MIDTTAPLGERLGDEFLALVSGDDEWWRAEFDAIIAANWPAPVSPGRASDRAGGERRFEESCLMTELLRRACECTVLVAGDGPARDRAPPD